MEEQLIDEQDKFDIKFEKVKMTLTEQIKDFEDEVKMLKDENFGITEEVKNLESRNSELESQLNEWM